MIHTPDNLQNTLDYLNYSGVVFYRDNQQINQTTKSQNVPNKPTPKKEPSNSDQIPISCFFCTNNITDDEYKVLGKHLNLCSTCKPLFTEIRII
ncbi:MAG: hypothetical protein ACFFAE_13405 [Candidatus Hodarchaeota archaeon]